MPRLRNKAQRIVVVNVSDDTADALSSAEWEPVEKKKTASPKSKDAKK